MSGKDQPSDQIQLAVNALVLKWSSQKLPYHPPTGDHAAEGVRP